MGNDKIKHLFAFLDETVKHRNETIHQYLKLVSSLPHNKVCEVIGGQLLRSGTSVGANMEEAQAAYSRKEFIISNKSLFLFLTV